METAQTTQTLTYGQKLCGVNFNPSKDPKVDRAKALSAELADLLYDHWMGKEHTMLDNQIFDHASGEILNAQMSVVKLLTLQY